MDRSILRVQRPDLFSNISMLSLCGFLQRWPSGLDGYLLVRIIISVATDRASEDGEPTPPNSSQSVPKTAIRSLKNSLAPQELTKCYIVAGWLFPI